jgi:predicted dehydrogenase
VACFADHISSLQMETEDMAEILVRHASGAIGNVHLDCIQRFPSRTCRIVGEEGTITWDYYANEVRLFEAGRGDWQVLRHEGFKRNDMYRAEMQHFLACLEGHEKLAVDVEEGARVLRLALAAYESAQTGKICDV